MGVISIRHCGPYVWQYLNEAKVKLWDLVLWVFDLYLGDESFEGAKYELAI